MAWPGASWPDVQNSPCIAGRRCFIALMRGWRGIGAAGAETWITQRRQRSRRHTRRSEAAGYTIGRCWLVHPGLCWRDGADYHDAISSGFGHNQPMACSRHRRVFSQICRVSITPKQSRNLHNSGATAIVGVASRSYSTWTYMSVMSLHMLCKTSRCRVEDGDADRCRAKVRCHVVNAELDQALKM
ncbi:uncharacterized protein ATNIH1004_001962 [Aspergillus tanneri]|uniref:Uncharacterized protein n=1 Tax=Aspergillus tanneri TaxID=1220188 RepID=A0A5M9M796_9EURO|nr:uncharacterized protein ATNIH1004_001962 [Aspergillus tanneri]KAA8641360.1 hypothetical protein ATNIH1004_001962 [Aspergillus tanneri]